MRFKEARQKEREKESEREGEGGGGEQARSSTKPCHVSVRSRRIVACARFQRIADIREAERKLQQRRETASDVSTLEKVL